MDVGAPFAVLVAEQLAASGAELVVSITSAGQIGYLPRTPCFALIERALRDEGTSVHYEPPGRWSRLYSGCTTGSMGRRRSARACPYGGLVDY